MYLPVPGFESTTSEFLDKCVTHWATVENIVIDTVAINIVTVNPPEVETWLNFFSSRSKWLISISCFQTCSDNRIFTVYSLFTLSVNIPVSY